MREPNDAAKSAKQTANSANEAADQALEIAKFTTQQADRTAAAKAEIDQRFPTDHALMVRALASQEQAATLRIGPRRNCWKELLTYEERLGEIEQRRAALIEEIAALNLKLQEESSRHTAALASWMEADEEGERPASRASELQAAIADRQAEYDALGFQYDATLQKRAEHVTRNRNRFLRDVDKAKEKAAKELLRLINETEARRQELLAFARPRSGPVSSRPSCSRLSRRRPLSSASGRQCSRRCCRT